ncbi:MAG: hypothetical protein HXY37_17390 [Chloroflexi bacterium]|nr:hypothetical protein [Chloroflexota bacterium]
MERAIRFLRGQDSDVIAVALLERNVVDPDHHKRWQRVPHRLYYSLMAPLIVWME